MNTSPAVPTRLRASSPGLGQGSQIEIEQRAAELAISDGRGTVSDADLVQAAAELAGGGMSIAAPEADAAAEKVTTWDEPPGQSSHRLPSAATEEEESTGEQLVGNGLEEADHDTRAAAESKT
jgi:hypothetical protein